MDAQLSIVEPDLPQCCHRGTITGDECQCRSDRLIHEGTVALSVCRRCPYADQPLRADTQPAPKIDRTNCRHRGAETRRITCETCGGKNTQYKVFACAVRGECLLISSREGIPSCRDCEDYTPPDPPRKVILQNRQAPGDILMLTGAVHALHQAYPGRFLTDVETTGGRAFWEHNPHITPLDKSAADVETVTVHYSRQQGEPADRYAHIDQSNQRPLHFLEAMCEGLSTALGLPQPLRPSVFRGDIYLSDEERRWVSQIQELTGRPTRYWILNAGHKHDFTCKHWGPASRWQTIIDRTRGRIKWVQVGQTGDRHTHPDLDGVIDLRGQTDLRQLVRLVYHADGVLSGVSQLMHLAAAVPRPDHLQGFTRPAVILAGGREPQAWNVYPGQQYLHTVGSLDCCRSGGCWKSRVVPLGDGERHDLPDKLCRHVRTIDSTPVPHCMELITPDDVLRALERYLD